MDYVVLPPYVTYSFMKIFWTKREIDSHIKGFVNHQLPEQLKQFGFPLCYTSCLSFIAHQYLYEMDLFCMAHVNPNQKITVQEGPRFVEMVKVPKPSDAFRCARLVPQHLLFCEPTRRTHVPEPQMACILLEYVTQIYLNCAHFPIKATDETTGMDIKFAPPKIEYFLSRLKQTMLGISRVKPKSYDTSSRTSSTGSLPRSLCFDPVVSVKPLEPRPEASRETYQHGHTAYFPHEANARRRSPTFSPEPRSEMSPLTQDFYAHIDSAPQSEKIFAWTDPYLSGELKTPRTPSPDRSVSPPKPKITSPLLDRSLSASQMRMGSVFAVFEGFTDEGT